MHMVIRCIVYAESKEVALDNAKSIFDNLCEKNAPFDYYHTFDDPGTTVSGRGRWGNIIPVAKVDSIEGKKLIEEGWKNTEEGFKKAITRVRLILQHLTDEQIREEQIPNSAPNEIKELFTTRFPFNQVGEFRGSEIWLYDNDGSGIQSKRHLKDTLEKWPNTSKGEYDHLDVWVVPTDVHY